MVTRCADTLRSYNITTVTGQVYHRNRQHHREGRNSVGREESIQPTVNSHDSTVISQPPPVEPPDKDTTTPRYTTRYGRVTKPRQVLVYCKGCRRITALEKKKRTAVHLFVVSIIPLNASAYYGNNLASIETNAMIMDVAQDAYCCNFSCLTNLTSLRCSVVDVFLVSLTAEVPDTMN